MDALERLMAIGGEAMSTRHTLINSYMIAHDVIHNDIPGAFVECGVYAGCQCGAMALAVQELHADRKIHCFDSFCGFPKASIKDDVEFQIHLGIGSNSERTEITSDWGFDKQTVAKVQANFERWGFPLDMFVFHEGSFHDTMPPWEEDVALLRIDADLYESDMLCLQYLYPRLKVGGVCIMEDYGLIGGRRAYDEYFQGSVKPIAINPAWWVKVNTVHRT